MKKKKFEDTLKKKKSSTKVSHKFITTLSIVSILGFVGIVSHSLFDYDISYAVESLWLMIIGIGLIFEARIKKLKNIQKTGLTSNNFTHLITVIIGTISILAGFFSFPGIRLTNPAFIAIKGIIAIIAIVIIAIQTWIIE